MDGVNIDDSNQVSHNEDDNVEASVEICRVCLLSNHLMRDLFIENDVVSLSTKAMSFANVKVSSFLFLESSILLFLISLLFTYVHKCQI